MSNRVVITGLGFIGPKSNNIDKLWDNLVNSRNCIKKVEKTNVECLRVKVGGEVPHVEWHNHFNKRFLKKCDNFSVYAMYAMKQAIEDARLDFSKLDPYNIGIYVGNNYGGLSESQKGLTAFYHEGREFVSPYLASNWFPAAPQGHASIQFGIKGISKTVIADMASSSIAIGNAYQLIKNGQIDYMIAGGTEAPLTTWGIIFYEKTNKFSFKTNDFENIYQPFSKQRSGMVLAEGAAFLVLENIEKALARKTSIYAELKGFSSFNDGVSHFECDNEGFYYSRTIRKAMEETDRLPDIVLLNGTANENEDNSEINGLNKAFPESITSLDCSCPKAFLGNSYGASSAMDTVIACLSMKHDCIIKTGNVSDVADNVNFNLITGTNKEKKILSSLVMSKGLGGINSALYLEKYNNNNKGEI